MHGASPKRQHAVVARDQRGVTVLELLIVMTILLMITAATIPLMIPALQNRRMRESSRLVSSFLSGARSRSIETGRPVGVSFQRLNGLPAASVLSYVEQPAPYAGDTAASKVVVTRYRVGPTGSTLFVSMISGFPAGDAQWLGLASYGDTIQLNHHPPKLRLGAINESFSYDMTDGVWYVNAPTATINQSAMGGSLPIPTPPPNMMTPPVGWILFEMDTDVPYNPPTGFASGVSFSIERRPTRFSAPPLQLPEGVVIDLYASGVGRNDTFAGINPVMQTPPPSILPSNWSKSPPLGYDPIIMFSPNGRVEWVTANSPKLTRPTAPVFLLVGRRELMADVSKHPVQVDENVHDPRDPRLMPMPQAIPEPTFAYLENFWVTVSPQTGLVTVTEMARNPQAANTPASVSDARSLSIQNQGVGGR